MLKLIAGAIVGAILAATTGAHAQDLQPRDYSPTDRIALRVVSTEPSRSGERILVAVGNRTSAPRSVAVECSLYDAGKTPIGTAANLASNVPPESEVALTIGSRYQDVAAAFCRVTSIRPAVRD